MRYVLGLGLAILLSSCATTNDNYYPETVQSWQGGHSSDLVKKWGNPDNKIASTNGATVYIYKTQSYRGANPQSSPEIGVNTSPNTNFTTHRAMSLSCTAVFMANAHGIITETKIAGNGCYGSQHFAKSRRNPSANMTK